jgi:hypothetical protein
MIAILDYGVGNLFSLRSSLEYIGQQVIVTAGACEALYLALFGTLNSGDEVILPTPAFLLYDTIATIAGAKVVPLDLTASGFQITKQNIHYPYPLQSDDLITQCRAHPPDLTVKSLCQDDGKCIFCHPFDLAWAGNGLFKLNASRHIF